MTDYIDYYAGERILVTGGSGSIGSFVSRALITKQASCERLVVFSRDETLQWKTRQKLVEIAGAAIVATKTNFVIGNMDDENSVREVISKYRISVVIHTAAQKHIPACEENPKAAVTTNVLGTINLIHACETNGVKQLILVSSDKAAEPISVMGVTKFLQERLVRSSTIPKVQVVRFGNVLGSRGSVVWVFKKQIALGSSLTLTAPSMKRFFMTPTEAADFVLWGGMYIPDRGVAVKRMRSCTVESLAKAIIGTRKDVKIEVIGRRQGEKDDEILLSEEEKHKVTWINSQIGDIVMISGEPMQSPPDVASILDININLVNAEEVANVLKSIGVIGANQDLSS